jgi:hypothetical protein
LLCTEDAISSLLFLLPHHNVAFAESTVFSGKVKSVDAAKGTLVITTEEDNTKQFSAPAAQLQGVKPGHEVDVEVVDGKVQSLQNFSTDN